MTMKPTRIFMTGMLLVLLSTAAVAAECPLAGDWKSNEAKTLASMHATGKVTPRQRRVFEHHYFGMLRLHFTCTEMTSSYAGDAEIIAYTYVKQEGNRITIRIQDEDTEQDSERVLSLEAGGKCFSKPVPHMGFNEYFCKTDH
jgi:hypothetical protein